MSSEYDGGAAVVLDVEGFLSGETIKICKHFLPPAEELKNRLTKARKKNKQETNNHRFDKLRELKSVSFLLLLPSPPPPRRISLLSRQEMAPVTPSQVCFLLPSDGTVTFSVRQSSPIQRPGSGRLARMLPHLFSRRTRDSCPSASAIPALLGWSGLGS